LDIFRNGSEMINCESDPGDLISEIGNCYFRIDEEYSKHPKTILIVDCEDETRIEISSGLGDEETMKAANALITLLNQDYEFRPVGE
jgi:hypothetical protein